MLAEYGVLNRVFFPFRRPDLGRHWWHRLAVVAFFAVITMVWIGIWIGGNRSELQDYRSCLELANLAEKPSDNCVVFPPHAGANFVIGVIAALVSSYLLQLIYYRVVLYVIFGGNTDIARTQP